MRIDSAFSDKFANSGQRNFLLNGVAARQKERIEEGYADMPNAPIGDASVQTAAPSDSSNSMARHFFNRDYQRSKYVAAHIQAAQQQQTFSDRMNSLMGGLTAAAAIWDKERTFMARDYSGLAKEHEKISNRDINATRLGLQSDVKIGQVKDEDVNEANEENLEDIQDEIEKKAEEAVAPDELRNTSLTTESNQDPKQTVGDNLAMDAGRNDDIKDSIDNVNKKENIITDGEKTIPQPGIGMAQSIARTEYEYFRMQSAQDIMRLNIRGRINITV